MKPFRSIAPYKITVSSKDSDIVRILRSMEINRFQGELVNDLFHLGFEPWEDHQTTLWLKAVENGVVCKIKSIEKKAPSSLISFELDSEIKKLQVGGRVVSKEERSQIRSKITERLSKKALPVIRENQVIFNEKSGLFWIDTINSNRQDQVVRLFKRVFPNSSITPSLVIPGFERMQMELITEQDSQGPKGIRLTGSSKVNFEEVGSRIGSKDELLKTLKSLDNKSCSISYLAANYENLQFRWHSDGCISHIETSSGNSQLLISLHRLTTEIQNWINNRSNK